MNVHPKVAASASGATIAGAITTLGFYILSLYGITVPEPVAESVTTLFSAGLALIAGYSTPSPAPSGQQGT